MILDDVVFLLPESPDSFMRQSLLDASSKSRSLCCVIYLYQSQHVSHHQRHTNLYPLMSQARHRATPSTPDPASELIDTLWDTVKPCALKLRDAIMQDPSLTPQPPGRETSSTPQSKLPSLASRRAACTHLTMDRLYGDFRCDICNRSSELGWVYSCSQDEESPTAASESTLKDVPSGLNDQLGRLAGLENGMKYGLSPPVDSEVGNGTATARMPTAEPSPSVDQGNATSHMPSAKLSPSIEKAIKNGHYTANQVVTLRAQKQHVFNMAKAAVESFEEDQRVNNLWSQTDSTSQSVDANPHLPYPLIHEVRNKSTTDLPSSQRLFAEPMPKMFPHCSFRACQLCRPTYRDRTWQCFDEVLATKAPNINFLGGENRPLASASVMRYIGLRSTPRRPKLRHFSSRGLYSYDEEGKIIFRNRSYGDSPGLTEFSESSDVADASVEPESRGFRESMKRAFKGMLAARSRSGRKRKSRESSSDEDAADFDMGLWRQLNDELLNEASSVPLPVKDSLDTVEGERVGRTDVAGVAVTEEAADLRSADIIMSV